MARFGSSRGIGAIAIAGGLAVVVMASAGVTQRSHARPPASHRVDLASACRPEAVAAVAATLPIKVTVAEVPNGPKFSGGVKLTPAAGKLPAFCQVTGSYETNPKTGKTANFIASFPENWNGKYMQLGCSGTCGYLLMNDPASPPITITAQGYPGQLMEKGYATFGDDLGHVAPSPQGSSPGWLKGPDGRINLDVLEDYLYRADMVLADMGKAFTGAFYARQGGAPARIARSYFNGCSQGGRNALIAATRFPEKFDGIIAGSPVLALPAAIWQGFGRSIVTQRQHPNVAKLTPGQVAMLNARMAGQCDAIDGAKDGLIQNPAACEFHPTRDIPICKGGESGDSCVSQAQAENISMFLAGMTDDGGRVIQPGYALGVSAFGYVAPVPDGLPMEAEARFLIGDVAAGQPLATGRTGGPGGVDAFHVVLNRAAYQKYAEVMRRGDVQAEDFAPFFKNRGKLLWYHNLSDEALTPYMSFDRYRRLSQLHGGYARLQDNIRLFSMPSTGHCGLGGEGPGNFDPLSALEAWVERGTAPNALFARQLDPAGNNILAGQVDWTKTLRTMPLCMFPQMASYKGKGDVKDAANWECRVSDDRMLRVGESGRQAGIFR